ncbi:CobW family GTP-binding protein [Streptomyces poonensis]|uniref:Cobalamin biosynthesis protein CobW n=1 Tax=Streptomyces poonensis TaxID=68255 RepID=A0A918PEK3_9ACTN|nr:GTP-binding protein [Streptomyces poonensis]GGZ01382.1 cobalamin biosynthesis protein CobW [Streptomyces poonensis]GLJ90338.1 cobalamin biosynthesis protein CobW [Streptomyces poonensis]
MKETVRALLGLDDDTAVMVRRLTCTEPGCPPVETVVAVLPMDGEPRRWTLHRPVEQITEDDLRAALLNPEHQSHQEPELTTPASPQPHDGRVPVTVLTGFLGSGKTTLLNRILTENHGMRMAVIENEFGEVGIDDALVLDSEEEIFEMNNGCICCTVRGDLIRILGALMRRRRKFDHILIETTGLADPAPVAQTFFMDDEIASQLRLDAIVTLVDAAHVMQHLDEEKPEGVENEAVEQIAFADRVVLNKTDLADESTLTEVEARIRSINAPVQILRARHADIDLRQVLDVGAFDLQRVLADDPSFLTETEHQHDTTVTSVGIELEGELDETRLNTWLGSLLRTKGVDIFRSKGILALAGEPKQYVFQGVHMLLDGTLGREWREGEPRGNKLVFIGRDLDRDALVSGFSGCLAVAGAAA